jgi:hypothetical protein
MGHPFRYNPVWVEIVQLNKAATQWDDDYKEPIGGAKSYDSVIRVRAQVNLGSKQFYERERSDRGEETPSRGHLVFKKEYWDAQGLTITRGDRIKKIAEHDCDFEIMEVRPESPLRGKTLLYYVEFEKRDA